MRLIWLCCCLLGYTPPSLMIEVEGSLTKNQLQYCGPAEDDSAMCVIETGIHGCQQTDNKTCDTCDVHNSSPTQIFQQLKNKSSCSGLFTLDKTGFNLTVLLEPDLMDDSQYSWTFCKARQDRQIPPTCANNKDPECSMYSVKVCDSLQSFTDGKQDCFEGNPLTLNGLDHPEDTLWVYNVYLDGYLPCTECLLQFYFRNGDMMTPIMCLPLAVSEEEDTEPETVNKDIDLEQTTENSRAKAYKEIMLKQPRSAVVNPAHSVQTEDEKTMISSTTGDSRSVENVTPSLSGNKEVQTPIVLNLTDQSVPKEKSLKARPGTLDYLRNLEDEQETGPEGLPTSRSKFASTRFGDMMKAGDKMENGLPKSVASNDNHKVADFLGRLRSRLRTEKKAEQTSLPKSSSSFPPSKTSSMYAEDRKKGPSLVDAKNENSLKKKVSNENATDSNLLDDLENIQNDFPMSPYDSISNSETKMNDEHGSKNKTVQLEEGGVNDNTAIIKDLLGFEEIGQGNTSDKGDESEGMVRGIEDGASKDVKPEQSDAPSTEINLLNVDIGNKEGSSQDDQNLLETESDVPTNKSSQLENLAAQNVTKDGEPQLDEQDMNVGNRIEVASDEGSKRVDPLQGDEDTPHPAKASHSGTVTIRIGRLSCVMWFLVWAAFVINTLF